MTSLVVAPVIPPKPQSTGRGRRAGRSVAGIGHRRVAVPKLPAARSRSSTYGFATVDDRGRIAAQLVFRSLGWSAGTRVAIRERHGLVVVTSDAQSATAVTPHGHLRLPAPMRHWCGLTAGCHVLLVADAAEQRLVIHPAAALDTMIGRYYADVFGGDAE